MIFAILVIFCSRKRSRENLIVSFNCPVADWFEIAALALRAASDLIQNSGDVLKKSPRQDKLVAGVKVNPVYLRSAWTRSRSTRLVRTSTTDDSCYRSGARVTGVPIVAGIGVDGHHHGNVPAFYRARFRYRA